MANDVVKDNNGELEKGEPEGDTTGFDIQEPDDLTGFENLNTARDGFIEDLNTIKQIVEVLKGMGSKDLEVLERMMKIHRGKNTENLKKFIVHCTGGMFLLWTVLMLLVFFLTRDSQLLYSDSVPATLFGVVVHHYFKSSKDGT
jgi:hypothetical protein